MNIKYLRKHILLIASLLILLSGCNCIEYFRRDSFYKQGSGWDYLRFPLIKPYYALASSDPNDKYGWSIHLEGDPASRDFYYYLELHDIQKIAVVRGIIMVYTPFKVDVDESVGQKVIYWFVFIPEQSIEKGFDNEADFLAYIHQYDIQEPSWRTPLSILQEYDQTWCLDWIPGCK